MLYVKKCVVYSHNSLLLQPELKALRWMKDQQTQQRRAASGTSTISMAAGVGSARNLSDCLGSTLDLGRMQDGTLARVAE